MSMGTIGPKALHERIVAGDAEWKPGFATGGDQLGDGLAVAGDDDGFALFDKFEEP